MAAAIFPQLDWFSYITVVLDTVSICLSFTTQTSISLFFSLLHSDSIQKWVISLVLCYVISDLPLLPDVQRCRLCVRTLALMVLALRSVTLQVFHAGDL